MEALAEFVRANLWLCLGAGVVIVIVGDEILGLSRALFGDAPEDRPPERAPPPEPAEPEPGARVEDFLPPRR